MLSMIQGEVVTHHHWMDMGQFTDIVAISQSTPGPIGINSATYVGYTSMVNAGFSPTWGILGSTTATFAVVLPSFILMLFIAKFLMKYKDHRYVQYVFSGLRPAVVGLLAAAALVLLTRENFSTPSESLWRFIISILIFIFAFVSQRLYKMNPILIVVICGCVGIILF